MERLWVEMLFLAALASITAALHYARGSGPAFAEFFSGPPPNNSALHNYLCLFAATATAYLASRVATAVASKALPASIKASTAARGAALLLLCVPATVFTMYAAAGFPDLGGHVAAQWLVLNWERNGKNDAAWCVRLFALLFFWQAALAAAAVACRALARGLVRVLATTGLEEEGVSSGRGGGGRRLGPKAAASASAAGRNGGAVAVAAAAAAAAAGKVPLPGDMLDNGGRGATGKGFDESAGGKDLVNGGSGGEEETSGGARSGMMAPALG